MHGLLWPSKIKMCPENSPLEAASHLFLRPIKVISGDTESDAECVRVFDPPECVSRDLWGPEIVVGHLTWNHFEATGPLQERSR